MKSMRDKYKNGRYAVYNGVKYEASPDPKDWKLILYSRDEKELENGFEEIPLRRKGKDILCKKYVSPYEVSEYYKEYFSAEYNGRSYSINSERSIEDKIMITGIGRQEEYPGFEVIEFGTFGKLVSERALDHIRSIKEDLLVRAKELYDSKLHSSN